MRSSKPTVIANKEGEACLLLLEASYCSEQENGILPIVTKLGGDHRCPLSQNPLPPEYNGPWGLKRTAIQPKENNTIFLYKKETKTRYPMAVLACSADAWDLKEITEVTSPQALQKLGVFNGIILPSKPDPRIKEPLTDSACWDKTGFICVSTDPTTIDLLRDIHWAACGESDETLGIWLGGAGENPFARNGICLGLINRIDPDQIQASADYEKTSHQLEQDANATGIPQRIEKMVYAAKPGRLLKTRINRECEGGSEPVPPTAHNVMFFINPRDQKHHNFGWYTVEELEAWLEGKGPVCKTHHAA